MSEQIETELKRISDYFDLGNYPNSEVSRLIQALRRRGEQVRGLLSDMVFEGYPAQEMERNREILDNEILAILKG